METTMKYIGSCCLIRHISFHSTTKIMRSLPETKNQKRKKKESDIKKRTG